MTGLAVLVPSLALTLPNAAEISEAIPVIISLIIIEGLLSVDNALAIAAMASHLPGKQKYQALKWGIIGAYVFRGLCLGLAAYIIENPWIKFVGAAYLIHLMASHLSAVSEEGGEEGKEEEGAKKQRGFWATVFAIEFMDLSLSVDNVVAAVALSPKLWVVCTGVFIGILALRFVAGACIKLIQKFPILEHTAFLLIGYVGFLLLAELTFHIDVGALAKFVGICIIVAICLAYERYAPVQKAFKPVFAALHWPLKIYSAIVGAFLAVLLSPFRLLIRLFTRKAPAAQLD